MRKKPFILVVDDNQILREKIAGVLSRLKEAGLVSQTSCVTNLEHDNSGFCPDLILMGLRTFRVNRSLVECMRPKGSIGVYIYGHEPQISVEKALKDSSVDGYVTLDELVETVQSLIESAAGYRRTAPSEDGLVEIIRKVAVKNL